MTINTLTKKLIERLLPSVPVVLDRGLPTPEFVRKWDDLADGLQAFEQQQDQVNANVGQQITNITNIINEGGESQIYVGPLSGAPANPSKPLFMILRENGAPAGATSFVIREPD